MSLLFCKYAMNLTKRGTWDNITQSTFLKEYHEVETPLKHNKTTKYTVALQMFALYMKPINKYKCIVVKCKIHLSCRLYKQKKKEVQFRGLQMCSFIDSEHRETGKPDIISISILHVYVDDMY